MTHVLVLLLNCWFARENYSQSYHAIDHIAFKIIAMHFGRWGLPREIVSLSKSFHFCFSRGNSYCVNPHAIPKSQKMWYHSIQSPSPVYIKLIQHFRLFYTTGGTRVAPSEARYWYPSWWFTSHPQRSHWNLVLRRSHQSPFRHRNIRLGIEHACKNSCVYKRQKVRRKRLQMGIDFV